MHEFNFTILASYLVSGYQFLSYQSFEHFAIIVPCQTEVEVNENSYIITINDEQVVEMAQGIDEFSVYVLL